MEETRTRVADARFAGFAKADRESLEKFANFGERFHNDAELRARVEAGDTAAAARELGLEPPPNAELRFVSDTRDVLHVVMPPDPNAALADEQLQGVVGGDTLGTAGTASTIMCLLSCASSGGTTSTLGSAEVGPRVGG